MSHGYVLFYTINSLHDKLSYLISTLVSYNEECTKLIFRGKSGNCCFPPFHLETALKQKNGFVVINRTKRQSKFQQQGECSIISVNEENSICLIIELSLNVFPVQKPLKS